MHDIKDNLQIVGSKIDALTTKFKRGKSSVNLLAVSKTKPIEMIEAAYDAGQTAFGENYAQELFEKAEKLNALNIEWHYIGPLQSNKTKLIANTASWVHTIDRLKIAQRLSHQREKSLEPLSICIQVNISEEKSKAGITSNETPELAKAIQSLPNIKLRGLMAIPAPTNDTNEQAKAFNKVRDLFEQLNENGYELDTLSMGMSGDMEAAIASGATIVRIGTDIFGKRDT